MEKEILKQLQDRISLLEARIFGPVEGEEIKLSQKGKETFDSNLRGDVFYFIRWHRAPELIVVRRKGNKTKDTYHHSFFEITTNPNA